MVPSSGGVILLPNHTRVFTRWQMRGQVKTDNTKMCALSLMNNTFTPAGQLL